MPKKESCEEQIATLMQEEVEIKEKLKALRSQKKKEERTKRTKHMIETGSLIYSILGRSYVDGDIERLAVFLKSQEERGKYFSKAMNNYSDSSDSD